MRTYVFLCRERTSGAGIPKIGYSPPIHLHRQSSSASIKTSAITASHGQRKLLHHQCMSPLSSSDDNAVVCLTTVWFVTSSTNVVYHLLRHTAALLLVFVSDFELHG
eukprot:1807021-Amphidinium_carterae.2